MKYLREYIINFGNLKPGKHEYDFSIDEDFFRNFEYSLIKNGAVDLHLTLDKQRENFFTLYFELKGSIEVECDRCLDMFSYPLNIKQVLHVKLDSHENDNDDELIFLKPDAYQIDISPYVYDFLNLALPLKHICESVGKECNPRMLDYLQKNDAEAHSESVDHEIDPRWAGLRNIVSNKDKK